MANRPTRNGKATNNDARAAAARCIARLEHGLMLAKIAVHGPEPEYAARYLVAAGDAIQDELGVLRRAARRAA